MHAQHAKEPVILICWLVVTCAWWTALPTLLGLSLPHPLLTLGLAFCAPILLLSAALQALDRLALTPPSLNDTLLNSSLFTALLTAALLLPAPVIAHLCNIQTTTALALILLANTGALLTACITVTLWIAVPLRDLSQEADHLEDAPQVY